MIFNRVLRLLLVLPTLRMNVSCQLRQACPKGKHVQDTLGNNNVKLSYRSSMIDHVWNS